MPIPPAVAVEIADAASKTHIGKRVLKGIGAVIGGVGMGGAAMGQAIGGDVESVKQAESRILVAVVTQYEAQAKALREQLAACDIELALCERE